MTVRTNTESVSQLPTYVVKRSKDWPSWFVVTCPRADCAQTFLVQGTAWRKPRVYKDHKGTQFTIRGRSCPYCFRAAGVPSGRIQ